MHWWPFLFFFCFFSILHARRHSSQQVCRHRITGQQLSEHPAADAGRTLGYTLAVHLCVLKWGGKLICFDCDYRSDSGNVLTVWMYAKVFLIPSLPETCCWVSSHTIPQHTSSVHLYICILQYVCGLPYVLNCLFGTYGANPSGSRPSPSLPFSLHSSCSFSSQSSRWTPLLSLTFPLFLALSRSALIPSLLFVFSASYFLPLSPSSFLPIRHSAPHSYASSITTVLFSLVSNHTHLEPAQLCSSTHGNHLKLLGWSPPLFLCPLFSYFSHSWSSLPRCSICAKRFISHPLFLTQIFIFLSSTALPVFQTYLLQLCLYSALSNFTLNDSLFILHYVAKSNWTHLRHIYKGFLNIVFWNQSHGLVQLTATTAPSSLASGFPPDFLTWPQGFAPIQPQEHYKEVGHRFRDGLTAFRFI